MAVNDALLLEGAIFQMIHKRFRKEPFYFDLLDLMHEIRQRAIPRITCGRRCHIKQVWVNLLI
jgi:hypothetical protein